MRVVHLVTHKAGGAYKAANRISNALSEEMDSTVITCNDISMTKIQKLLQKICHKFFSIFPINVRKMKYYFNSDLDGSSVLKMKQVKEADIIHIHWIADGMLSLNSLKKMCAMGKPIVWTLHDMHPFTGGCHYNDGCDKYKSSCGACKQIESTKNGDFTTWNQRKKLVAIEKANIVIVGCSRWITRCASDSTVMNKLRCMTVPNCIETDIYKPCDKSLARERLNIKAEGKKIIAFGAINSTSDKRKGFAYLKEACKKLDKEKYMCLVLGGSGEQVEGMQTVTIDYLHDDYSLALFYAAADVFVAPSIQENLANTVVESLSSGTPVVAFNIGGMPDLIISGYNGYLAKSFDTDELVEGIERCCHHSVMGENARTYALLNYCFASTAKQYMEIYDSLLRK